MELGASRRFHIDLELLEVTLRNSIDLVMSDAYGVTWLTSSSPQLLPRQQQAVADVEADLLKDGVGTDDWHGRVIAKVPFGFWTALMGPRYEGGLTAPGKVSRAAHWPRPMLNAFPRAPNIDRRRVAGRFHAIRMLRNRVSHHEAVWHGVPQKGGQIQAPKIQDAEVIGTIGWISSEMATTARAFSQVTRVYDRGLEPYRRRLLEVSGDVLNQRLAEEERSAKG